MYPAGLSMELNDYVGTDSISESVSDRIIILLSILYFQRRAAFQLYIVEVLGLLAREAGISDENLSDRTFTVASDVFTIERFLADVCISV